MYVTGHGVQQDYSAAALWFRKAAEQGYAFAQSNLGALYRDGRGVTQDYVRAHMWFSLAAAQGVQRAVKTLNMAERKMTPAQITKAQ
jgi:TPR repeat protein